MLALVPVCGHEFSMPAKDGFGSHDGGKLVEHLAAEDLAFDGQPASLAVVEEYAFLSELLPEYLILSEDVLDGALLLAIDPAREGEEQQVPWLKLRFHVSSGCAVQTRRIRDRWLAVKSRNERHERRGQDTPSQSFTARVSFFTIRDSVLRFLSKLRTESRTNREQNTLKHREIPSM